MIRRRGAHGFAGFFLVVATIARADESVVGSFHDLSVHSPHAIRAVNETQVCVFCHTPHNAAPQSPLWNREDPTTHYLIYRSSTTDARIDQPAGPSKMCLSCHDGSLALGNVLSRPATGPITMTARTIPPGPSDLTGDLSDDHPIGFRYDRALFNSDRQLRSPDVVSIDLPLGPHGEMHCTTCHDAHNNELGNFLRKPDRMSIICVSCHDMTGWPLSAHATSTKNIPGRLVDPADTLPYHSIRENACTSCHKVHSADRAERLLRGRREEDGCLNCHNGAMADYNIAAEIGKRSAHDVRRRDGVHDPTENALTMIRHVECSDCHNPHAVQRNFLGETRDRFAPTVAGPILGVPGVSITGRQVDESLFAYEICLKCHGDSVFRPKDPIPRRITQTNTRLEFQPSNPSFHPVAGPRRSSEVVSLIPPMRVGDTITCTDCHNSDNSRFETGNGPDGPHGSIYEPLLERNYETTDFTVESEFAYALCYKCHSRDSILNDDSFSLHRLHVVDQRSPCSACHDAHGIYRGQGTATANSALINFDTSIVTPAVGRLEFQDRGRLAGNCTLTCHGIVHVNFPYNGGFASPDPALRSSTSKGQSR